MINRYHSHLSTVVTIIEAYDGTKPLEYFLKNFFSADKKYGSRDRKTIASLCYNYFRVGHLLKGIPLTEKVLAALFICEDKSSPILAALNPQWDEQVSLPVSAKLSLLNLELKDIFPFAGLLSDDIEPELFAQSFLKQPGFYLRIRPGKTKYVMNKLTHASISFTMINNHCLQLVNSIPADTVLKINRDAVVQDYNSQQVFNFIEHHGEYFDSYDTIPAWDCCAASGGKSILLYDILKGKVQLTVSDIRESILHNLKKRMQQAGINIYEKFIADLSKSGNISLTKKFQIIICDAPCTGSGTWARTPEQLFYFDENILDTYVEKQQKIVSTIIPQLTEGGLLFYITCSVFKRENEELAAFIQEKFSLRLLQMENLKGYDKKADTMFVAVFSA